VAVALVLGTGLIPVFGAVVSVAVGV
jgi:hypothetical protein